MTYVFTWTYNIQKKKKKKRDNDINRNIQLPRANRIDLSLSTQNLTVHQQLSDIR